MSTPPAERKQPNIVFVTIDALRPDHLGYMGYSRKGISPFIDSLADKGTVFRRAFSTGPGSPHSFVAIFTSTYPFDHGGFAHIDRPRVLFPEALQSAGYATYAFHSNAYMSSYFGYDRGWDEFHYVSPFQGELRPSMLRTSWQSRFLKRISNLHAWLQRRSIILDRALYVFERSVFLLRKIVFLKFKPAFFIAEEMNAEVYKVLPAKPDKPTFLWVHYMETHSPYGLFWTKSRRIWKKLVFYFAEILMNAFGDWPGVIRLFRSLYVGLYDDAISYVDQEVKNLFAHLRRIGVLNEDTIVAITADHGEEFFDHGQLGHNATLWNVNTHVPLLICGGEHDRARRIERPVSLIDLPTTFLELAGAPVPQSFKGKNIFRNEDRPVVAQLPFTEADLTNQYFLGASIVYGSRKLIHMTDARMLFDLDNDFVEHNNIYEHEPETANSMETMLEPYRQFSPKD